MHIFIIPVCFLRNITVNNFSEKAKGRNRLMYHDDLLGYYLTVMKTEATSIQ